MAQPPVHQLLRGQQRERAQLVADHHQRHRLAGAKHQGEDLRPRLHHYRSLVLAAHQHTSVPREEAGQAHNRQLRTLLPSAWVPQSWGHGEEQAWGRGQCSKSTPRCTSWCYPRKMQTMLSPRDVVLVTWGCAPQCRWQLSTAPALGWWRKGQDSACSSAPLPCGAQPAAELQPCLLGQHCTSSTARVTGGRPEPVPRSTPCPPSTARDAWQLRAFGEVLR